VAVSRACTWAAVSTAVAVGVAVLSALLQAAKANSKQVIKNVWMCVFKVLSSPRPEGFLYRDISITREQNPLGLVNYYLFLTSRLPGRRCGF
jgi:hypothetical protein